QIGAGKLDQKITVSTGDELETLAGQFNDMSARLTESYGSLERKVDERTAELSETLQRQTTISEILRVISNSPTDMRPILDAVAVAAGRLCTSDDVRILLIENGELQSVASFGSMPTP